MCAGISDEEYVNDDDDINNQFDQSVHHIISQRNAAYLLGSFEIRLNSSQCVKLSPSSP